MIQLRSFSLLLPACLAGGLLALHFGFALEWDLLNYHLYNPHAWLTGRLTADVAPAQLQTFLNPALQLPVYALFRTLGPEAAVFATGAVQAGQVVLLYLLIEEILGHRVREPWLLLPVALLGLGGPIFLNQLGGSQGDTLLSAFVLGGLLIIVREFNRPANGSSFRAGLLAGILLGVAGALKLTLLLFAPGIATAALLCFPGRRRWQVTAGLAGGGVLGWLLAGAAWSCYLWQTFGNPLLPYFNNLFGSEWVNPSSYRDLRFMPRGVLEWIGYPWVWFTDPLRVWERPFQDIRVPLLVLATFLVPLFAWRRMRRTFPALGLMWVFVAVSYLLWLSVFSIYRYLSVLELLAPAVLFCTWAIFAGKRWQLLLALVLLAGTQLTVEYYRGPASWNLRADTPTALAAVPPGAMVITGGYEPVGYAAIWLDQAVPFVRFRSNVTRDALPSHRLRRLAHERIRAHDGPVYLLSRESDLGQGELASDLADLGFQPLVGTSCVEAFGAGELQAKLELYLCRLARSVRPDRSEGR